MLRVLSSAYINTIHAQGSGVLEKILNINIEYCVLFCAVENGNAWFEDNCKRKGCLNSRRHSKLPMKRLYVGGDQMFLLYRIETWWRRNVENREIRLCLTSRQKLYIVAAHIKPRPNHSRQEVRKSKKVLWSFHHHAKFSLRSSDIERQYRTNSVG